MIFFIAIEAVTRHLDYCTYNISVSSLRIVYIVTIFISDVPIRLLFVKDIMFCLYDFLRNKI